MADENEHAAEAIRLIRVAREETPSIQEGVVLASAQVEATLALVEEVRTLSLATLGASDGLGAGLANAQVRRRLGL
jgi:hypothetical protein